MDGDDAFGLAGGPFGGPFGRRPSAPPRGADINGKGLPEFGTGGAGDLMVRVVARVPDRLPPDRRELFEKMQESRETRA